VASPIPDEPPVTSATFIKLGMVVISSLLYALHQLRYPERYGQLDAK
jgi:hypothetical protein